MPDITQFVKFLPGDEVFVALKNNKNTGDYSIQRKRVSGVNLKITEGGTDIIVTASGESYKEDNLFATLEKAGEMVIARIAADRMREKGVTDNS